MNCSIRPWPGWVMSWLTLSGLREGKLLRVFIDKPDGISVDDCVTVSNHLSRLFAVESIDYDRLEVSSPGLDRPLKKTVRFHPLCGRVG